MRLFVGLVSGAAVASALISDILPDNDYRYCHAYRGIASSTCRSRSHHHCESLDYEGCQNAFNELPAVQSFLDRTRDPNRSKGCLADYTVGNSHLQHNEASGTTASAGNYALCICEHEVTKNEFRDDYKHERGDFEAPAEWCNGWGGDISIDPTQAFQHSHVPTRTAMSMAGGLQARAMGMAFTPGVGLQATHVSSIGIYMRYLTNGVMLKATLHHAKTEDCNGFHLTECPSLLNNEPLFRDREMTPGEGDLSHINYVDFYDLKLKGDHSYMFTVSFPGQVPLRNDPNEPFFRTRVWVYKPTTDEPEGFNYTHTNITYMTGVHGVFMPLSSNTQWERRNIIPDIYFKLCAKTRRIEACRERPCTIGRFFSFHCAWWSYLLAALSILLIAVIAYLFCCLGMCGGGCGGFCDCIGGCCSPQPTEELCVCLNFIDFDTGERWYRKGVRLNMPIKLLAYEVAELLNKPRGSTTLWLRRSGRRMKWCYTVQDYRIDANDDIFVVQRGLSNIAGCCSIEDVCCCCFASPDFSLVNVEDERAKLLRSPPQPRPPVGGPAYSSPVPGRSFAEPPSGLPSLPPPSIQAPSVQMQVIRPTTVSRGTGMTGSRMEGQMRGRGV